MNDTRLEDTLIVSVPDGSRKVDWYQTVRKIKQAGETLGYTLEHFSRCIERLVAHYEPALLPAITHLPPVEKGRFLLSLKPPADQQKRLHKEICQLTREVGTPLGFVMNQLGSYARGYYEAEQPAERDNLINRLMIRGLQSFTTGQTNTSLRASLQHAINTNTEARYRDLIQPDIQSEEMYGQLTTKLFFLPSNQPIGF